MKILCTGDIHIGRSPSRVPADISARSIAPWGRWLALVELAIAEKVDVVAMSGDLVDRENRFFEAFGPLEQGVRQLAEAGIQTIAVAGNHDFDVLPRLHRTLPMESFRLLGEGGRWERAVVESSGGEILEVHGWSFPGEDFPGSPLHDYTLQSATGTPVLGLLHCDLDVPASRYAPVTDTELRGCRPELWLLGHVHQPRLWNARGAASLLYPGSPQPLDPGEQGEHGVWLVETAGSGFGVPRLVPLATVRYDRLMVDVTGIETVEDVQSEIVDVVARHRDRVAASRGTRPEFVCCHVFLEGRTRVTHREIEERILPYLSDLDLGGPIRVRVDRLEPDVRPLVDLDELSRGGDAPGLLASLLLRLDRSPHDPDVVRLLETVAEESERVGASSAYAPLRSAAGGAPPYPAPVQILRRQAYRLLEELIAQKELT